jgi:hypothetical protein
MGAGYHPAPIKYIYQHQADASIDQAAPAQNTWYTVLNTTVGGVRIIIAEIEVATAAETLELEIVIDGNTLTAAAAVNFATPYFWRFNSGWADTQFLDANEPSLYRPFVIEGASVGIRARKTTANGAGNLKSVIKWARLLPV